MNKITDGVLGALLAVCIAIAGAMLIAHWAACEQHEAFCSISSK